MSSPLIFFFYIYACKMQLIHEEADTSNQINGDQREI